MTLIDDGTLPNHWGSVNMDDEGHKTQRNVLIEKGMLKGYLIDRFNGRKWEWQPQEAPAGRIIPLCRLRA